MPITVPLVEDVAPARESCAYSSLITSQRSRKVIESFHETRSPGGETEGLTPREQEVLELLAAGDLYKQIADKLQISYRTVSTHTEHIYGKLRVHSRAQAVAKHLRQA